MNDSIAGGERRRVVDRWEEIGSWCRSVGEWLWEGMGERRAAEGMGGGSRFAGYKARSKTRDVLQ